MNPEIIEAPVPVTDGNGETPLPVLENTGNPILGTSGDDVLTSLAGADLIDGGEGADTVSYDDPDGVRVSLDGTLLGSGTAEGDTFISIEHVDGSDGDDLIAGDAGDNILYGFAGIDQLYGQAGSDVLNGGGGDDALFGGEGGDRISGSIGNDLIFGGDDNDFIIAGQLIGDYDGSGTENDPLSYLSDAFDSTELDDEVLHGEDGRDAIYGGYGNDTIFGGNGDDGGINEFSNGGFYLVGLFGGFGNDLIFGADGNDALYGEDGADVLHGENGNDDLFGASGNDELYGGNGRDLLRGRSGADLIDGGAGFDAASYLASTGVTLALDFSFASTGEAKGDRLFSIEAVIGSESGNDRLAGNSRSNELYGEGGNDTLYGRAGNDFLGGYTGDDKLYGEGGKDQLIGGSGKDLLSGGYNFDRLEGGSGSDTFRYDLRSDGGDTIVDFGSADFFAFKSSQFGGLKAGRLNSGAFHRSSSNKAADAEDRFIYRTTDDTLWYDSNGSASGGTVVKIADLETNFLLSHTDILIV